MASRSKRALTVACAVLAGSLVYCTEGDKGGGGPNPGPTAPTLDAGTDGGTGGSDAGTDAGTDGGTTGSDAGTDGGTGGDGGTQARVLPEDGPTETAPSGGWEFVGTAQGGPSRVMGAAVDEGGNLWVAGGGSGLFVRLDGESRFRQTSTPYPAISVAAGAAGVGYVGYQGLSNCDMAWDEGGDRSVYKSGDADRVTVTASGGFRREHYDISSGRGVVAAEPQGREKVCDIVRLRYDAKTQSIWFGGNHGVAWGDANSTRVMEHTHPSINGYLKTSEGYHYTLISGFYYGLATDARGDLWLGGTERSAKLEFVEHGGDFYGADDALQDHKIDVWADDVPQDPYPSQMVPDETMGFAPLESGLVWAGSMKQGVAVMDEKGKVLKTYVTPLLHREVSAVVADPLDGSVWFGHADGGLTRLKDGKWIHYTGTALGRFASGRVYDLNVDTSGPKRRIVVAFQNGGVGLYSGD